RGAPLGKAAMALRSLRRWPSESPILSRCDSVSSGNTSASMSFSRNAGSDSSSPNLRSQTAISIFLTSGPSGSRCVPSFTSRSNRYIGELRKQRFGILQIGGVEALGEPAVDRRQKLACLGGFALVAPQPGEAGRGTQLPRLRLL